MCAQHPLLDQSSAATVDSVRFVFWLLFQVPVAHLKGVTDQGVLLKRYHRWWLISESGNSHDIPIRPPWSGRFVKRPNRRHFGRLHDSFLVSIRPTQVRGGRGSSSTLCRFLTFSAPFLPLRNFTRVVRTYLPIKITQLRLKPSWPRDFFRRAG